MTGQLFQHQSQRTAKAVHALMRGSLDRPRVRAYTLQRSLEDLETIRLQQTGELFQTPHPGGLPLWQEPPSTNFSSHS